jgi:hypothetical protein
MTEEQEYLAFKKNLIKTLKNHPRANNLCEFLGDCKGTINMKKCNNGNYVNCLEYKRLIKNE